MAEGKAKQETELNGFLTISDVLDNAEKEDGQETTGQEVENESSLQDPQ